MKKVLLVCLFAMFAVTSQTYASSVYTIDDSAVEAVFDNSVNVMNLDLSSDSMVMEDAAMLKAGKSPIAAFVICWVLGGLAIHRVYLGGTPLLVLGYIAMGLPLLIPLGILVLGDWIVLLIDVFRNDLGKHEGNDALFMW